MMSQQLRFDDFYFYLQSFLTTDDYLCFINTSKKEFSEIKRRTIYLKLTKITSAEFLMNSSFRRRVLQTIDNPTKQLSLTLATTQLTKDVSIIPVHSLRIFGSHNSLVPNIESFVGIERLLFYGNKDRAFPYLPDLKRLTILSFHSLTDVHHLSHLSCLKISYCIGLRDIKPLRNISNLTIDHCYNIEDFSCLGGQSRLIIRGCKFRRVHNLSQVKELVISFDDDYHIDDWHTLKGVYSLTIEVISNFFDLSGLGNHHFFSLQLGDEGGNVSGIHRLKGVKNVQLYYCVNVDLTVFDGATGLILEHCAGFSNLEPLKKLKKLSIHHCHQVQDLSPLQGIPELSLQNLDSVNHISSHNIGGHQKLALAEMGYISAWDDLKDIRHLTLDNMNLDHLYDWEVFKLPVFQQLVKIEFIDCHTLIHVDGLGHVPHIRLVNCYRLSGLFGLGNNRSVYLKDCTSLTSVAPICDVPVVTIVNCPGIKDISYLRKTPRLKVIHY